MGRASNRRSSARPSRRATTSGRRTTPSRRRSRPDAGGSRVSRGSTRCLGTPRVIELERALDELGLRGLFLHPWQETFPIADHRVDAVVEIVRRRGLPVIVAAGYPFLSEALQVGALARRAARAARGGRLRHRPDGAAGRADGRAGARRTCSPTSRSSGWTGGARAPTPSTAPTRPRAARSRTPTRPRRTPPSCWSGPVRWCRPATSRWTVSSAASRARPRPTTSRRCARSSASRGFSALGTGDGAEALADWARAHPRAVGRLVLDGPPDQVSTSPRARRPGRRRPRPHSTRSPSAARPAARARWVRTRAPR